MEFPFLQGKRSQPPLTDAPVGSPPELLRIVENQTALLMQIKELLQRSDNNAKNNYESPVPVSTNVGIFHSKEKRQRRTKGGRKSLKNDF